MSRPYHLQIGCTDKRRHDWRELAVLIPVRPRVDRLAFAAMGAEVSAPTGEYAAALARGWGVQGSYRTFDSNGERYVAGSQKRPVELKDARNGDVIVHLLCPYCGRNPQVPASVLFRAGDAFAGTAPMEGQKVRLDISALPPGHC